MKNIFIIGNGFDLAHGYNTDYASFIFNLIDTFIEKEKYDNDFFIVKEFSINYVVKKVKSGVEYSQNLRLDSIKFKSILLEIKHDFINKILKDIAEKKWCDIEVIYYESLKKTKEPEKLNDVLTQLKNELEKYLCQFNKEQNAIAEFSLFFEKIGKGRDNLVLNFNYTNTFDRLYNKNKRFKVLNFHGQLNSKTNPIIFGYAPTEEETKLLIDKNDNEYLKNIKRYYYKQTNNENKLYGFLGSKDTSNESVYNNNEVNVFVIGHSCGVSDRKILNDIFTYNSNVKNINIMYYKDYQGYFDTLVNIDRIIGDESEYGVIRNFELSLQAPQYDDSDQLKDKFNEKIIQLVNDLPTKRIKEPLTKSSTGLF